MFRFPSGQKSAGRAQAARRFALVASLFIVAASLPFITQGAGQQDEIQPRQSGQDAILKGQSNVIEGAEFVPGEVLVRFRTDAAAKSVEAAPLALRAAEDIDVRVERFEGSDIVRGLRLAKVDPAHTLEAVKELASRPDVLYAEPNYIWRATRAPNDPRFASGGMYGLNRIGAPVAWDTTIGSKNVVVGVLDGGVDINHEDLKDNIWTNPGEVAGNNVDDDGNGFVDDVNGWDFEHNDRTVFDNETGDDHATHVAGTIGARGDNGIGVVGVNWQVSIMSLKVLGPTGGSTSKIINGYNYARMMRQRWDSSGGAQGANIRVLNNSYGGTGKSLSALDAILQLNSAGILFVAAAGNDATDNFSFAHYPSNYDSPNVLAVAATNSSSPDGLSSFSNFGARVVSMGAPGSSILSTTPNNTYSVFSGTSMASPHVAGAAALVCAAVPACANGTAINSGIAVQNLRGVLAFTGDRVPALDGKTTTGRRLNVANAVASALENDVTPPAPVGNLRIAGQNGRSVTLAWSASGDDGNAGTAVDYDLFFVNPTTQGRTLLPTSLIPATAGTEQSAAVDVPFRNFSGTIQVRAYDNAGNSSTTSVPVSVPVNSGSDPYIVTESDAQPLSTGGTLLALTGDDKYLANHQLPFAFPFYGVNRTSLTISTNGTLYFSTPPRRDNGDADDVPSSNEGLQGQTMIAGLWDDIDINTTTRADSGVYVTQPDANRVIFRWQGVTFNSPRTSVNFEIELRSDGTIQMRYGDSTNIFPVVGISGGEPEAYLVSSHTRERVSTGTQPINLTGAQTVTFSVRPAQVDPGPQAIQFNAASFTTPENSASLSHGAVLRVTRTNTAAAATVDVRTVDDPAAVPCDPAARDANGNLFPQGTAYARCDYATTVETLQFAPGEASKDVVIPIINDAFPEPTETLQVVLSNPTGSGATLGTQTTATLSITDNDVAGMPNPIFSTSFFVRQQYLDFLSREPEQGEPWSNVLNGCSDVNNNPNCDRLTVSKSFFRSVEFQLKGFFVYRFYGLSFRRLPLYTEIVADMRSVTGATEDEVYQKKGAFANNWVQRPSFKALFPDSMSAADFVNTLMDRYALQSITTPDPANPDRGAKVTLTRTALFNGLSGGTLSRAQIVRAIADSDQLFAAEYNRAFVAMQYFGYLRRDPDTSGFNGWLNYLNNNPTDDRTMVRGFANSTEYQLRFGPAQ